MAIHSSAPLKHLRKETLACSENAGPPHCIHRILHCLHFGSCTLQAQKKTPIVCVSTGTGIAPFRSFWRRLFYDAVPGHEDGFQGNIVGELIMLLLNDNLTLRFLILLHHQEHLSSASPATAAVPSGTSESPTCMHPSTAAIRHEMSVFLSLQESMHQVPLVMPCMLLHSYHTSMAAGKFWLLAGFANEDSVLYGDELRAAQEVNDNFRLDIALSLQQQNKAGGPAYVQDRIEENAEEFLQLMTSTDAQFYFCGLKRMYTSVLEVLQRIGAERGLDAQ
eukprot:scaffold268596_cov18-Tisochrysis_lutea.AAC.1